jgi:hypothetical protein
MTIYLLANPNEIVLKLSIVTGELEIYYISMCPPEIIPLLMMTENMIVIQSMKMTI